MKIRSDSAPGLLDREHLEPGFELGELLLDVLLEVGHG